MLVYDSSADCDYNDKANHEDDNVANHHDDDSGSDNDHDDNDNNDAGEIIASTSNVSKTMIKHPPVITTNRLHT